MTRSLRAAFAAVVAVASACSSDLPTASLVDASARVDARADAPSPPVIWLHYDYMVQDAADEWAPAHSDAPHRESLDRVVDAFRNHGIQVVIDPQHTVLPHATWLGFDYDGYGCASTLARPYGRSAASFAALKAQYFHPHANRPWHYVIFGHGGAIMTPGCAPTTGQADLPGYDFMVTYAGVFYDPSFSSLNCGREFTEQCARAESGTIMHELGHNLDLRHGGGDDENYKPNYFSVMNYQWSDGVFATATAGSTSPPYSWRLDYSSAELPPLDENHLDERVGLNGPAWSTLVSYYECFVCSYIGGFSFLQIIPTTPAPVDWNGNGVIEPDVAIDVNYYYTLSGNGFWPGAPEERSVLVGFDDWSHVRSFAKMPAYVRGEIHRVRTVP